MLIKKNYIRATNCLLRSIRSSEWQNILSYFLHSVTKSHDRKIVQKYSPVIQSSDVIFNKWMPDTIKFVYGLKKISSNLFQNIFRSMKTLQRNSQKATNSSTTEVSYCISVRTKRLRTKLVKSGNLHSCCHDNSQINRRFSLTIQGCLVCVSLLGYVHLTGYIGEQKTPACESCYKLPS